METKELREILKIKGFREEKIDTGINLAIDEKHIELVCYIEPGIDIAFITLYKWDNNEIKGTYNISEGDFKRSKETISSMFKRTLNNMPVQIGDNIRVHKEVEKLIDGLSIG